MAADMATADMPAGNSPAGVATDVRAYVATAHVAPATAVAAPAAACKSISRNGRASQCQASRDDRDCTFLHWTILSRLRSPIVPGSRRHPILATSI
jgi:hypothetical protein